MSLKEKLDKIMAKVGLVGDGYKVILQPPYEELLIEQEGDQIMFGYQFEQNGDLVPDPHIYFKSDDSVTVATQFGAMPDDAQASYANGVADEIMTRLEHGAEWKVKE